MGRGAGYSRSDRYRRLKVYVKREHYLALHYRALNEGRSISDIINELLDRCLGAQAPAVQGAQGTTNQGNQATTGWAGQEPFSDNPWVEILRSRRGQGP